jgi:hypothetical protein
MAIPRSRPVGELVKDDDAVGDTQVDSRSSMHHARGRIDSRQYEAPQARGRRARATKNNRGGIVNRRPRAVRSRGVPATCRHVAAK